MAAYIAVVDDNPDLSIVLCALLTDEGYQALPIRLPVTAHKLLQIQAPEVIIQDLDFGGRAAGVQLLSSIRQDPALASIPVIVCSADVVLLKKHHDAFDRYGYRVVTMPFDLDDILSAVRAALETAPDPAHDALALGGV